MRRLFTINDALARGLTPSALRWGEHKRRWRRVCRGVYAEGPDDPTPLDQAVARVLATGSVARGCLAGVLLGLDGVSLDGRPTRRRSLPRDTVTSVDGIACADGLETLVDLASCVDDAVWEQALESALRKRLVTVAELEAAVPVLGQSRTAGTARIRRVLALRPSGAPSTESLLETLMVQLVRTMPGLPDPVRQYELYEGDLFVARLDLAWPSVGLFLELDGQHHAGQPVYDARRETAVVASTGWLCGRFTWHEVVRVPNSTRRRLAALYGQCLRRPLAGGHPQVTVR